MNGRLLTLAAALAGAAHGAQAQRWRTLDASRQLRDTTPLNVRVEYAAGRLDLAPGTTSDLYAMHLRYDADRVEPLSRFDSAARALAIGVRSAQLSWNRGEREEGTMQATLSARVPMELTLEIGAVEGDVQLGGLRLTDFALKGGAAELTLRFDAPNPVPMRAMTLEVGAADVKVLHAINAQTERVQATVGVGALDLDFTGPLAHDLDISASLALGDFTLRVSPEVGVYADASTFLGDLSDSGLEKRAGGWYSPGYDKATRHVRVRLRSLIGGFKVKRTPA